MDFARNARADPAVERPKDWIDRPKFEMPKQPHKDAKLELPDQGADEQNRAGNQALAAKTRREIAKALARPVRKPGLY
jgi:hypothetical protein